MSIEAPTLERRRQPRWPCAFAFWIKPQHTQQRVSAWMLDMSEGGAAFLTPAEDAPPVGARVQLLEMLSHDPFVRERSCPLPAFARVVRHDAPRGATVRVAVQFEVDEIAALPQPPEHDVIASRLMPRIAAPPPPPVALQLAEPAYRV